MPCPMVQQLGRVEDERQREFIGRKLSLESVNMFTGIKNLTTLDVNEGQNLNQLAEQINQPHNLTLAKAWVSV